MTSEDQGTYSFPKNDYSDEGQLLGHILIATRCFRKDAGDSRLSGEYQDGVLHCILSHHGELEYGSPKKPATMEAFAPFLCGQYGAKLETMREFIEQGEKSGKAKEANGWVGFNKLLDSNVKKTFN